MLTTWGPALSQVLSWVAALGITGSAAAAVAFAVFRFLAKGWLKNQFDKDLENFKASKNAELEALKSGYGQETERLRGEINRLMDRATKFHAREYDVLPEAWGLLSRAHGSAGAVIAAFQMYSGPNGLNATQLSEFFEDAKLRKSEIEAIEAADDHQRNIVYGKIRTRRMLNDADRAAIDFNNYIILNGIFIEPHLEERMREAGTLLRTAVMHRGFVEEGMGGESRKDALDAINKLDPVISQIKADVQTRLWDMRLPGAEETTQKIGGQVHQS